MSYGTSITLNLPFAGAAPRVRAALQEQGFGVLTEVGRPLAGALAALVS